MFFDCDLVYLLIYLSINILLMPCFLAIYDLLIFKFSSSIKIFNLGKLKIELISNLTNLIIFHKYPK